MPRCLRAVGVYSVVFPGAGVGPGSMTCVYRWRAVRCSGGMDGKGVLSGVLSSDGPTC